MMFRHQSIRPLATIVTGLLVAVSVTACSTSSPTPDEPDVEEDGHDEPEPEVPEDEFEVHYLEVHDDAPVKGPDKEEALVTIHEFSSFESPFCGRTAETLDKLLEQYGDEVRLVFHHFPLPFQEQSEPAARAAVAADNQDKFWEMRDVLFENQDRFDEVPFEELARDIGLDIDRFNEDFDADETAEAVREAKSDGESVGVDGLPGFLINGIKKAGAIPLEVFEARVEQQIEIARDLREERGLTGEQLHRAVVEHNEEEAGAAPDPEPEPEPAADEDYTVDTDNLEVAHSYTKGAEDPELRIWEFSSYQCPFCARVQDTLDEVLDDYDNVQLVYKNFPLPFQKQSEPAARAALAAGEQGSYWEMHDALFDNQDRLEEDGLFEELARDLGLNIDQFQQDFESDEIAERVEQDQRMGRSVGVEGTPGFIVGDQEMSGAQPADEFRRVIDDQLED